MADLGEHKLRPERVPKSQPELRWPGLGINLRDIKAQGPLEDPLELRSASCKWSHSAHKQIILNTNQSQRTAVNCGNWVRVQLPKLWTER